MCGHGIVTALWRTRKMNLFRLTTKRMNRRARQRPTRSLQERLTFDDVMQDFPSDTTYSKEVKEAIALFAINKTCNAGMSVNMESLTLTEALSIHSIATSAAASSAARLESSTSRCGFRNAEHSTIAENAAHADKPSSSAAAVETPSSKRGAPDRYSICRDLIEAESMARQQYMDEHATPDESAPVPNWPHPCKQCGKHSIYMWTAQTRSSDEASTVFYKCLSCGNCKRGS